MGPAMMSHDPSVRYELFEGGNENAAAHSLLFGVPQPQEYWWKRRYREHNDAVRRTVSPDSLLVMDIAGGDKWDVLCPFLGVEEPDVEWPWENKKDA